jgi:hypothetical protein
MGNCGAFKAGVMVWASKIERVGELYDELSIGEI